MSNRVAPGETIPTTSQLDAIHHTSALALNNEEQPIRKDQIVVVNWKLDKGAFINDEAKSSEY